ncbi:magnesium chelatase domain-containing protein [Coxiella-like endosymbiont]|uniref:magnesium chelatase domain-containing protein n=1 Tax=Coxiella-like endosymbiont TaxID=1592897 RepID=UPI0034E2DFCC
MPADLPREGGRFDLAIALRILAASNQIPQDQLNDYEFLRIFRRIGFIRRTSYYSRGLSFAISTVKVGRSLIITSACKKNFSL